MSNKNNKVKLKNTKSKTPNKKKTSSKIVNKTNLKKTINNNDNKEEEFELLKQDYIKISKEIFNLQNEINKIDLIRDEILKKTRNYQMNIVSQDDKLVLSYNMNDSVISSNINILTPSRNTDMETDDSDSEELLDLNSDSDSDS